MNEELKHYYEYRALIKKTIEELKEWYFRSPRHAERPARIISAVTHFVWFSKANLCDTQLELERYFEKSKPEEIREFIRHLQNATQDNLTPERLDEHAKLNILCAPEDFRPFHTAEEQDFIRRIGDFHSCISKFLEMVKDISREKLDSEAEEQPQPEPAKAKKQPKKVEGKTPKERMQYIPELNRKEIDKIMREAVKAGILDENYRPITEIDIQLYPAKWGTQTFEEYGMAMFAHAIAQKFEFTRRYNVVFCKFWGVPNLRQAKSDKTEAARQKARYVMNFIKNHIINS